MKKLTLGCFFLLSTLFFFNSCSKDKDDEASASTTADGTITTSSDTSSSSSNGSNSTTTDVGVVINGVKWATRNVDAPGTFASAVEDTGMFYQWNSKVGWPSTWVQGSSKATNGTTTWSSGWTGGYTNPSLSDTWKAANDPSPKGWRVPTKAEIDALLNTTKVTQTWTTQNRIYGMKFTDNITGNTLFFPVLGCRCYYVNGSGLDSQGSFGHYWSSTADTRYGSRACGLYFGTYYVYESSYGRAIGLMVRSVSE